MTIRIHPTYQAFMRVEEVLQGRLMKMRIMQTNELRGLLYEFGIALPVGHGLLLQRIQDELSKAQEQSRLPTVLVISVHDQPIAIITISHTFTNYCNSKKIHLDHPTYSHDLNQSNYLRSQFLINLCENKIYYVRKCQLAL